MVAGKCSTTRLSIQQKGSCSTKLAVHTRGTHSACMCVPNRDGRKVRLRADTEGQGQTSGRSASVKRALNTNARAHGSPRARAHARTPRHATPRHASACADRRRRRYALRGLEYQQLRGLATTAASVENGRSRRKVRIHNTRQSTRHCGMHMHTVHAYKSTCICMCVCQGQHTHTKQWQSWWRTVGWRTS